MRLLKCPKCGEMFSDTYKTCPFCQEDEERHSNKPVKNAGRRTGGGRAKPKVGGGVVIVCLVLLGLLTLHGGRRTAFGDEIVTQAMSYRRFLRRVTQSQLLSRLAQDSQYFYRILPYAEAIGLGAGLARTLGNTELEQCDWYQEQQPLPRTAAGFYSHLQEALALLELSIRK